MEIKEVVGIDVSKLTLDCCVHKKGAQKEFKNDPKGILKMVAWSLKKSGKERSELLFVFEHTGLYSDQLVQIFDQENCHMYVASGLEIKRSLGIVRGKDDKADAKRIALYGFRMREEIKPRQIPQFHFDKIKTVDVPAKETRGTKSGLYSNPQRAKKGAEG